MPKRVTVDVVEEVLRFREELVKFRKLKNRKQLTNELAIRLSPEAQWLAAFAGWFVIKNRRWRFIDKSKFLHIPPDKHGGAFLELLKTVRFYEMKAIRAFNEDAFCKFLAKCNKAEQELYLLILSGDFTNHILTSEFLEIFPVDQFNSDWLYKHLDLSRKSPEKTEYPLVAVALKDVSFPTAVLYRTAVGCYMSYLSGGELKDQTVLQSDEKKKLRTISSLRFALVGRFDSKERKFYPSDYFESLHEFNNYMAGEPCEDFVSRAKRLNRFLADNFCTLLDRTRVSVVNSLEEWQQALLPIATEDKPYVLTQYEETSRTGNAVYYEVVRTTGIISKLWVENKVAKGFVIWMNAEEQKCLYSFSGDDRAFVYNEDITANRLIEVYAVKYNNSSIIVGKEVKLADKKWRSYRLRRTNIQLEKCAFCGGTDVPHEQGGLCRSCYRYMYDMMDTYGAFTGRIASNSRNRKRRRSFWQPSMLNAVQYQHRGYLVRAYDDWTWGFVEDEETMKKYLKLKEKYYIYVHPEKQ